MTWLFNKHVIVFKLIYISLTIITCINYYFITCINNLVLYMNYYLILILTLVMIER